MDFSDVISVCKAVYEVGEQYEDGTAAVDFQDLYDVGVKCLHSDQ